jgi:hypothetical protein
MEVTKIKLVDNKVWKEVQWHTQLLQGGIAALNTRVASMGGTWKEGGENTDRVVECVIGIKEARMTGPRSEE